MGAPYMGETTVTLARETVKMWGNPETRKEMEAAGVTQKMVDDVKKKLNKLK